MFNNTLFQIIFFNSITPLSSYSNNFPFTFESPVPRTKSNAITIANRMSRNWKSLLLWDVARYWLVARNVLDGTTSVPPPSQGVRAQTSLWQMQFRQPGSNTATAWYKGTILIWQNAFIVLLCNTFLNCAFDSWMAS